MLAVSDPFYKITSEALLVTQQLVKVMRPLGKCYLIKQTAKSMRLAGRDDKKMKLTILK